MSVRPHPCPVCQQLTTSSGMCDSCRKRREASGLSTKPWSHRNEAEHRKNYGSSRWQKLRKQVLARDNYLCQECLKSDRFTPATEVHHIKATVAGGKMFDADNLISICHACHELITEQQRRGGGI